MKNLQETLTTWILMKVGERYFVQMDNIDDVTEYIGDFDKLYVQLKHPVKINEAIYETIEKYDELFENGFYVELTNSLSRGQKLDFDDQLAKLKQYNPYLNNEDVPVLFQTGSGKWSTEIDVFEDLQEIAEFIVDGERIYAEVDEDAIEEEIVSSAELYVAVDSDKIGDDYYVNVSSHPEDLDGNMKNVFGIETVLVDITNCLTEGQKLDITDPE